MLSVFGNPMMMHWSTYDKLGVKVHSLSLLDARHVLNNGIENTAEKKYTASCRTPKIIPHQHLHIYYSCTNKTSTDRHNARTRETPRERTPALPSSGSGATVSGGVKGSVSREFCKNTACFSSRSSSSSKGVYPHQRGRGTVVSGGGGGVAAGAGRRRVAPRCSRGIA